jgi:hypothetical protein
MYRSTHATYPLVCIQAIGPATERELDDASRAFAAAFERGGPIVCIADVRRADHDAVQRRLLGDWANHVKTSYGARVLAVVVVLDSALLRGALTALNWISPPTVPQPAAANVREAVALAKRFYEQASVLVPPQVWVDVRVWFDEAAATG